MANLARKTFPNFRGVGTDLGGAYVDNTLTADALISPALAGKQTSGLSPTASPHGSRRRAFRRLPSPPSAQIVPAMAAAGLRVGARAVLSPADRDSKVGTGPSCAAPIAGVELRLVQHVPFDRALERLPVESRPQIHGAIKREKPNAVAINAANGARWPVIADIA